MKNKEMLRKIYYENKAINRNMQRLVNIGLIGILGGIAKEASRLNRELKDSEKERRKLEKELQRKEKALAEAAALLVLSKKANAIWGDSEDE